MKKILFKIKNIFINIKEKNYPYKTKIKIFLCVLVLISLIFIFISNYFINKEKINWETIYYVSQSINIIITMSIPLIIFSFQNDIEKTKNEENTKKIDLEDRIEKLEKFVNSNEFLITEKNNYEITKNDIFKYISINPGTSISEIAKNNNLNLDKIKEYITELCMFDRLITSTIDVNPKNPDENSRWYRKN